MSCTRLRILLNTTCRKPGFNSLRTPLNHGAEQASNETLKQTQQRNWSNASQGGQTARKEHFAVLHYETASTTQQPRGEHRGTIKDCKIAGATTWQGQGNHTFTTSCEYVYVWKLSCTLTWDWTETLRLEYRESWVATLQLLFLLCKASLTKLCSFQHLGLSIKNFGVYPISLLSDLCNVDYVVHIAVLTTKYKYVQHKYTK